MKYTGNYNLKKPDGTDIVNIDDFNENADIIDAELKKLNDAIKDLDADGITLPDGKTIAEKFEEIETEIGNIEELDTDTKSNIIAAINEIYQEIVEHKAEKATQTQEGHIKGIVDNRVVLGQGADTSSSTGIAIGVSSFAGSNGTVLGNGAKSLGIQGMALGYSAEVDNQGSLAIGYNTSATANYGIALGHMASTNGTNGIVIGKNAVTDNPQEGILGNAAATNKWTVPGSFTVNGTKNFEIPHPKPEKQATHRIRHGAVESPTAGDTLYRWKIAATKENDLVTIDLPDYFIWLNKNVQVFVTPQGHFGNGYGVLNRETEQLEIHCQYEGEYNVLVIGTRNDNHQSVQDWDIKGVEREVGESWTGETYAFSVDEIIEVEEIKEVS